jgi:ankyrin repeat protein
MRYYIIADENLKSSCGLQYKNGENFFDIKNYNYLGYFRIPLLIEEKYILYWCDYGSLVKEKNKCIYEAIFKSEEKIYHYAGAFVTNCFEVFENTRKEYWNIETIKSLIKNGANYHICAEKLLRFACYFEEFEIAEYLLSLNCNIDISDGTIIGEAACRGKFYTVKFLVEHGANITFRDYYPLRIAAHNGYLDIVKLLISYGANVHAREDFAARKAREFGHFDVENYIIQSGDKDG